MPVEYCPNGGKERMTQGAARTAISAYKLRGTQLYAYRCKACTAWHLTKQKKESRKGEAVQVSKVKLWRVAVRFGDQETRAWEIRSQSLSTAWAWMGQWAGQQPKPVQSITIVQRAEPV